MLTRDRIDNSNTARPCREADRVGVQHGHVPNVAALPWLRPLYFPLFVLPVVAREGQALFSPGGTLQPPHASLRLRTNQPTSQPTNQRLNYDRSLSYATVSWERPGSRLCTEFSHSPLLLLLLLLLPKGPCSNINPLSNACAVPEDASPSGQAQISRRQFINEIPSSKKGDKVVQFGKNARPGKR